MGQLNIYRCRQCGYEIMAPDNTTGRYDLMSGPARLYLNPENNEVEGYLISEAPTTTAGKPFPTWNKSCPCPKCGGRFYKPRNGIMVMVD